MHHNAVVLRLDPIIGFVVPDNDSLFTKVIAERVRDLIVEE